MEVVSGKWFLGVIDVGNTRCLYHLEFLGVRPMWGLGSQDQVCPTGAEDPLSGPENLFPTQFQSHAKKEKAVKFGRIWDHFGFQTLVS